MKRIGQVALIVAIFSITVPAIAQGGGALGSRTSTWGIRVGLATEPDQIVGGVHLFETEIANNVFLEPNFELGLGDDHVILSGTAPFHYRFTVDAKVRPYAGRGVTVGVDYFDKPGGGSDTNFEIALRATGGIMWRLKGGTEMFGELNLIFGDLHDFQAMIGWRF
jgi:hypothetical protein